MDYIARVILMLLLTTIILEPLNQIEPTKIVIAGGLRDDGALSASWDGQAWLIVGNTHSYGLGNMDAFLIKVNGDEHIEWARTIGETMDYGMDSVQSVCWDGQAYLAVGTLCVEDFLCIKNLGCFSGYFQTILLLRISMDGELEWAEYLMVAPDAAAYSVCWDGQAYLVSGYAHFDTDDIFLARIFRNGSVDWVRVLDGSGDEFAYSVCWDGQAYLAVGAVRLNNQTNWDILLLRISKDGSTMWIKTIGGVEDDGAYSTCWDGREYIITGFTTSNSQGGYDSFILKVSMDGELEWAETFGGADNDEAYYIGWNGRYYIIVGATKSSRDGDYDLFMVSSSGPISSCGIFIASYWYPTTSKCMLFPINVSYKIISKLDWLKCLTISKEFFSPCNPRIQSYIGNAAPMAYIDSAPSAVVEEEVITLAGHGVDADGSIIEYEWSLQDGQLLSKEASFNVTLPPGNYTIRFRVKDDQGLWSEYVKAMINVRENNPPIVSLVVSQSETQVGVTVKFHAEASDPDGDKVEKYIFNYGDGTEEELNSPNSSHTYSSEGIYTVVVKAMDSHGKWSNWSCPITLKVSKSTNMYPLVITLSIIIIGIATIISIKKLRKNRF